MRLKICLILLLAPIIGNAILLSVSPICGMKYELKEKSYSIIFHSDKTCEVIKSFSTDKTEYKENDDGTIEINGYQNYIYEKKGYTLIQRTIDSDEYLVLTNGNAIILQVLLGVLLIILLIVIISDIYKKLKKPIPKKTENKN